MAKDDRLYGRFTLDFADSPKIAPLSDSAFRVLVEMTLHSRRMLDDGFVDERIALRKWPIAAIEELLGNDRSKPSLTAVDGGYTIHDFAEHQQTREDIEKKRSAGRKGGLARAQAHAEAPAKADAQAPPKLITESESETETETQVQVPLSDADASDAPTLIDSNWQPTQKHVDMAARLHLDVDRARARFVDHAERNRRRQKSWNTAFTNWLKKDVEFAQQRQGMPVRQQPMSNAEKAALEYQRLYGGNDESAGSIQALDQSINGR